MSFKTFSHFDSTSLLIVKTEIDNSIKNVENTVSSLLEDNSLPFGIEDALLNLKQASNVLYLVGRHYVADLTCLVAKVMQKVIDDAKHQQVNASDVEAMSEATSIIRRYLDFLCIRETRAPQFLIPVINKLEIILKQPLTREGVFLSSFLETIQPSVSLPTPTQFPESQYASRLYKFSLLRVLKHQAKDMDFDALSLCGHYFASQATGYPSQQYWRYVQLVLQTLKNITLTEPRLRVLVSLERKSVAFFESPEHFHPTHADYADVMTLCLSQDSHISYDIRNQLNIFDDVLSDNQLEILSRQLYGPDFETIKTVSELCRAQLDSVSSKIELGQHFNHAEAAQSLYDELKEVCNVLDVINLNDASRQLRQLANQLKDENPESQDAAYVNQLMLALLSANNSLQILQRNYVFNRLRFKFNNTQIILSRVEEAQIILCEQGQKSLQHVITHINQYLQVQDINVLQPLPELLREVSGALLFLEAKQGYEILQKAAQVLENHVVNGQKPLDVEQLRLLAAAIASADFFFEQLLNRQPMITQTFNIGQHSIDEFERAVA